MSFRASNGCEPCGCDESHDYADVLLELVTAYDTEDEDALTAAIHNARQVLKDYEQARVEYREFEAS